jgi:hypothetical protein
MPIIETELTRLLGIEHPILLAPMGSAAGGKLAAAVTNAGGLGLVGSGDASSAAIKKELAEAQDAGRDRVHPLGARKEPGGAGCRARCSPRRGEAPISSSRKDATPEAIRGRRAARWAWYLPWSMLSLRSRWSQRYRRRARASRGTRIGSGERLDGCRHPKPFTIVRAQAHGVRRLDRADTGHSWNHD